MPVTASPLRYPGGKMQLSPFVENIIRLNRLENCTYVEPFAGGAGVAIDLLNKGKLNNVIINDYDISIYALWQSILHHNEEFIRKIKETPVNIEEWYKHRDNLVSYNDLFDLGFSTFYLNRCNRSGIIKGGPIGGYEQTSKYNLDCRFPKDNLIKKIQNIALLKNKIEIYNLDAELFIDDVIKLKVKPESSFIFFDPPYYKQGKNLYTNFFKHEDHKNLSNKIHSLENHYWITTYDQSEEIADMYRLSNSKKYYLNYSANTKRIESEYLFHNSKTLVESHKKVQLLDI